MRAFCFTCLMFLSAGWTQTAFAKPPEPGFLFGTGEKIVHVADLPSDVHAQLKQQEKLDLAVGFHYRHFSLFAEGLHFWTWNGKFVLFQRKQYWILPEEKFVELLGQEKFDSLSKPFTYWVPTGILAILGIGSVIAVCVYFSPQARLRRQLNDPRYQEALAVYAQHLPKDSEPTEEDKQQALTLAATALWQEHGIRTEIGEQNLQQLIAGLENQQALELSHAFRYQALEHEEAGQWNAAIDCYAEAACLRKSWDEKDYDFLLECIERVKKKQRRKQTD